MIRADNQCSGKHQYPTAESASMAASHLNNKRKRLTVYRCPECGLFHFGHQSKAKRMKAKTSNKIYWGHTSSVHKVDGRFLK